MYESTLDREGIEVFCNDCGCDMIIAEGFKSGVCSKCTQRRCLSLLSTTERDKLFGVGSKATILSGRPRGWRWMKEFVDKDGNVYHKGVEQPKLKGKRQMTDIEALRKKRMAAKEVRRKKETKKLIKMAAEKKALKKAIEKQKDFLNHKAGK